MVMRTAMAAIAMTMIMAVMSMAPTITAIMATTTTTTTTTAAAARQPPVMAIPRGSVTTTCAPPTSTCWPMP